MIYYECSLKIEILSDYAGRKRSKNYDLVNNKIEVLLIVLTAITVIVVAVTIVFSIVPAI